MMGAVAVALKNPYPGLRPFDTDESELFFGRETQTDELLRCLGRSRFVAVIGTSGSGKSSMVRASLLPALLGGFLTSAGSHWHLAVIRPGGDPVGALADGLHSALSERTSIQANSDGWLSRDLLEITLMRSSLGIVEVARQAALQPHENLLIVVDQFEELFRFQRAHGMEDLAENAARFVSLLLEVVRQSTFAIHVLITMRADFLGDCSQFRDLPETINKGLYLIPRMTRDQLKQAITGPAAVTGSVITPRLTQELLNDLGDDPDQLPVLQHALMRAWNQWRNTTGGPDALDIDVYRATGGMAGALSLHANEVWEELSDDGPRSEQQVAKRLFQCLTEKGPDNREVRRPTRLGNLCRIIDADVIIVKKVIEAFREEDRAFLMPPRIVPLEEDSIIDISHESLIRKWDRLRTWVDEEAHSRAIYLRLAEAARLNHRGEAGLWRDPDLQLALDWKEKAAPNQAWAERYDADFPGAMEFLNQSVSALRAEKMREDQIQRRERDAVRHEKQRRRVTAIMIAAVLVAGVFGYLLFRNHMLLQETIAGRLASQAALLQKQKDAALSESVLLAVQSLQMQKSPLPLADDIARRGLALLPKQLWSFDHKGPVKALAFSPDGNYVAFGGGSTSGDQSLARVLDVKTGKEVAHLAHKGQVLSVAFSPDSRYLATGGEDGTARIMNVVAGGTELCRLQHARDVNVVGFSPDGSRVATGSNDGTARTMDASTCKEIARLTRHEPVVALAFSPDGQYVMTGSFDHTARLMHSATGKEVWHWDQDSNVYAVAFSPDGRLVAAGSGDGDARVGDAKTGHRISDLVHEGPVFAVAFSPDSKKLATASSDHTARVMRADTGKELSRLQHQDSVNSVVFFPGGEFIGTASDDNTARVIQAATGREISRMPQGDGVNKVAVSKDGMFLATAGNDLSVRLYTVVSGKQILDVPSSTKVQAVRFTPDGKLVAIARTNGTAEVEVVFSDVERKAPLFSTSQGHTVFDVAFSEDGRYAAIGGADGSARILEVPSGRQAAIFTKKQPVLAVALSTTGRYVAIGADQTAQVVERETGQERFKIVHQGAVIALAFSRDGRYLATGSADKTTHVIEVESGRELKPVPHQDMVVALAFSNDDSRYLAAGGADGMLRVIEVASGKEISRCPHRARINSVAFGPDDHRFVATGSEDGTVRLVEASTGLEVSIMRHQDPVTGVSFRSNNLLETFAGHQIYTHRLPTRMLIDQACEVLTRNLTRDEFKQYMGDVTYRKICPHLP